MTIIFLNRTPFRLFHEVLDDRYQKMRFRFTAASLRGSVIYYMLKGGKTVGYCLLEPGGWRYTFAEKSDVVIAPYVIAPGERGKGLGRLLIDTVISELYSGGGRVWAVVGEDNPASMKTLERAGFTRYSKARKEGIFNKFFLSEEPQARYFVYFKDKGKAKTDSCSPARGAVMG